MSVNRRTAIQLFGATALAMPFVRRARAEEGKIHVYNWVDYIGETTLEDFKKATGVEVVYDTYDSAETVEAKVMAGSTGYDVIDIASLNLQRFIQGNAFEKLDRSKLPNLANMDPAIMKVLADRDPGNQYAVPYMWGTVGTTYNLDMVKERLPNADLKSLDTLLKPENISKLADCGINVLESPADVIPMVLKYLGRDPDSEKQEDYDAVVEVFKPIRQYIKTFDSANYLNALPNKELCVSGTWSGDYATAATRAKEAGVEINLAYDVPATGSPAWFDVMVIPADAPNKEAAYKFLNFIMDPEVIAKCTNFTNYANANLAAKKFVDKSVLEDPAVYPSDDIMKTLFVPKSLSQKGERLRTRAWNKIKSGS
jgi:putrescine transport system substrate-binding protein